MAAESLPLNEISISELFTGSVKTTYEIPIYQRNYAWEKDEISALVQDIYDAYKNYADRPYYIGTLVTYHKGDQVYEVIDGQQRLTTLWLMLKALDINPTNMLTYRARKKSDRTLGAIPHFTVDDEKDSGIENGYRFVVAAINDLGLGNDLSGYKNFFLKSVHIIQYRVPKDIDLNHYFEIMNSRGEQLEKHEIVKANLMEKLDTDEERTVFNRIWECCSEMSVYVQQNIVDIKPEDLFGFSYDEFLPDSFESVLREYRKNCSEKNDIQRTISIESILRSGSTINSNLKNEDEERKDSFQPIIDFPNFLLIVLKVFRMNEAGFIPVDFNLDDKELLNEFSHIKRDSKTIRDFAFTLLKCRFLLDNYIVHHSKEEDTMESNPWKLQVWHKDVDTRKGQLKNLSDDQPLQDQLVNLLSMFEVSFTARQRKNYLFYCLLYLTKCNINDLEAYAGFLENLARRYFTDVYLDPTKLNAINTPMPGSFDEAILDNNVIAVSDPIHRSSTDFVSIYGDGTTASRGVPLYIFNYLDYLLWKLYDSTLRGERFKEGSRERREFFDRLGCSDFGQKVFDQFYFSRTRRSLEHYYPQANATGIGHCLNQDQINCLGNYAMIGSEANSSGSNWSPETKLDHYLDSSKKISQISVASIKFMIMMQMCRDHQKWEFDEIQEHQARMILLLMDSIPVETASPSHEVLSVKEQSLDVRDTAQLLGRAELRRRYWRYALPIIQKNNAERKTFDNCKPKRYNTVSGSFGISGFRIDCVANYDAARIDFYMGNGNTAINKRAYDVLFAHKDEIESSLGIQMSWDRADDNIGSWMTYHLYNVSIANEEDWPQMAAFHAEWSRRILDAFLTYLVDAFPDELLLGEVSYWTKTWALNKDGIHCNLTNCSRNYTRFTTDTMTGILPELMNAPSAWNTDSHYFYEIFITSTRKLQIQFVINSRNITSEFRALCD